MNWKRAKKISQSKPLEAKAPRSLEEIQKEHDQTISRFGVVQYQIEVLRYQRTELSRLLMQLNNEGAQAKELEAKKAKEADEKKTPDAYAK